MQATTNYKKMFQTEAEEFLKSGGTNTGVHYNDSIFLNFGALNMHLRAGNFEEAWCSLTYITCYNIKGTSIEKILKTTLEETRDVWIG